MLVRLKKEIIAFGVEGIDPARRTSPKLSAKELKRWLDEGRPGHAAGHTQRLRGEARNLQKCIAHRHRSFPRISRRPSARLPPELKKQPIVMFCTGGIRCEKAGTVHGARRLRVRVSARWRHSQVFRGSAAARTTTGSASCSTSGSAWIRACRRPASSQCFNCQTPLSAADQQHPHYVPGKSCPYCFKTPAELRASTIAQRQRADPPACSRSLPGSQPYDHLKPVNVPAAFDGQHAARDAVRHLSAHSRARPGSSVLPTARC